MDNNPDVMALNKDPAEHYLKHGWIEERNPSSKFSTKKYLKEHPECQVCPLLHTTESKKKMSAVPNYELIAGSSYFDREWYLKTYPDVAKIKTDPVVHYLNFGWKEGRNPGPKFDTIFYLNKYPDVKKEGVNPLIHFLKNGIKEKRLPREENALSVFLKALKKQKKGVKTVVKTAAYKVLGKSAFFDRKWYLRMYPEVKNLGWDPVDHYLNIGWKEHKNPGPKFDGDTYLSYYSDLSTANINPLYHYEKYGKKEERKCFAVEISKKAEKILLQLSQSRTEKNRILLFSHCLTLTGAPLFLYDMAKVLQASGYEVVVISPEDGRIRPRFEKNGIRTIILEEELLYNKVYLKQLAQLFDACFCNTILMAQTAQCIQSYLPTYLYLHENSMVISMVQKNEAFAKMLLDIKNVICVSEYAKEVIQKYFNTPLIVLHNFVTDLSKYVKKDKVESKTVRFAICGHMAEIKGLHLLLEAFNNLKNAELHVIGKLNPYGEALKEKYRENSAIFWDGVIAEEQKKAQLFAQMDVFVVPSLDETCSLVALEAASLGKALIITKNVGAKYLITDKVNGLIVPTGSVPALKKAMNYFLFHRNKIVSFGNAMRRKYLATSTLECYQKNIERLLTNKIVTSAYNPSPVEISVVLPCYNSEKYLRECLDSLVKQTYQNFEVIAVNDNSKDSTLMTLKEYQKNGLLNLNIVNNQLNIGPGACRNLGILRATGRYLTFMDHDDFVDPHWLEKLHETVVNNHADIAYCYASDYYQEDQAYKEIAYFPKFSKTSFALTEEVKGRLSNAFIPPWTKLVKTDIVKRHHIFFAEDFNKFDDVLYNFFLLTYAKKVAFCSDILYFHRMFAESITVKSLSARDMYFDHFKTLAEIVKKCAQDGVNVRTSLERIWPLVSSYKKFVLNQAEYEARMKKYIKNYRLFQPKNPLLEKLNQLFGKNVQGGGAAYPLLKKSEYFNKHWYLQTYPDVKKKKMDPLLHYINIGWKEGKNPGPNFDGKKYCELYPDVQKANMNPLYHYEKFGKYEGRQTQLILNYKIAKANIIEKIVCLFKAKNPKISVIVASFNYEDFIKEALDSLVAQTYKNFEVIIVDDGSKDSSVSVIETYVKKYPNFHLYTHPNHENKGLPLTIELALSKATGSYVAFLESDDKWRKDYLERKVQIINSFFSPKIIINNIELIGDEERVSEFGPTLYLTQKYFVSSTRRKIDVLTLRKQNYIHTLSSFMVQTKLLRQCCLTNTIRPSVLDKLIYRQVCLGHFIHFCPEELTIWRLHKTSYTTRVLFERIQKNQAFVDYVDSLLIKKHPWLTGKLQKAKRLEKPENQKKILVYMEPHPIRNEMTTFVPLFDLWQTIMNTKKQNDFDVKFFTNVEHIEEIVKKYPIFENYFLMPTEEEEEFFQSQLIEWDTEGISKWISLSKDTALTKKYVSIIKRLHKAYPFDYICNWGTNRAVPKAAKELGVGYADMELGCSRKPYMNSYVCDPWGVNGMSSISKSDFADFVNCEKLKYNTFRRVPVDTHLYDTDSLTLKLKREKRKIAFIPLQLYDDANLLLYAPYEEVIDVVKDIVPKLAKKGYLCVIKEHPYSALRKGSNAANQKAKKYCAQFKRDVCWLDAATYKSFPNQILYELADLVITVNSSAGFEGLYYDKPVVVLGDAVYKTGSVFPTLDQYLAGRFDKGKYLEQIAVIREFFLNHYLIDEKEFLDFQSWTKLVAFVGNLSRKDLTTKQIIEAYYKRKK